MAKAEQFAWLVNEEAAIETYAPGDVIFSAGDDGRHLYVVRSGEVSIKVGQTVVDIVGRGGIFGEMALIDSGPRSASAIATTACEVLPVDERKFIFLVHETPFFALDVMRSLAERLRKMNELI